MLKQNDIVLYGSSGTCRVKDFCKKKVAGEEHEYAVLETEAPPKTTIYLPLKNKALLDKVKPVLSPEELLGMIQQIPECKEPWIENQEERRRHYREMLTSCERTDLIGMIRTLYARQGALREQGKKLHTVDERAFKEARRLLHNEIAFVMRISPEEVEDFISSKLEGTRQFH